jgi:hypothetical protein
MAGTKWAILYATDVRRADNDEVWFRFALAAYLTPKIQILNVAGELQNTLDLGQDLPPGEYTSRGRAYFWDRRDDGGLRVAAGTYFAKLYVNSAYQTQSKFALP